jgi:hypothetical protein
MSIKGLGTFSEATKAGAFAQAVDQAAKSDRQSRKPVRKQQPKLGRFGDVGLWKLLSGPAWVLGVIGLSIVIELVVFSD